jgi:hypothetical protein
MTATIPNGGSKPKLVGMELKPAHLLESPPDLAVVSRSPLGFLVTSLGSMWVSWGLLLVAWWISIISCESPGDSHGLLRASWLSAGDLLVFWRSHIRIPCGFLVVF